MTGSRAPARPRPDPLAVLEAENAALRLRLAEATETLEATRSGEVEALVIEGPAGPPVFALASAEAASNALHGAMLAQVSDAVIAVDAGGRLTYLNAAAERMYGVPATAVLGHPVDSVYHRRWLDPAEPARAVEALTARGVWRGESLHELRDGRVRRVESCVTRLAPVDRRPAGLLSVNRDVTERHDGDQRNRSRTGRSTPRPAAASFSCHRPARCGPSGNSCARRSNPSPDLPILAPNASRLWIAAAQPVDSGVNLSGR